MRGKGQKNQDCDGESYSCCSISLTGPGVNGIKELRPVGRSFIDKMTTLYEKKQKDSREKTVQGAGLVDEQINMAKHTKYGDLASEMGWTVGARQSRNEMFYFTTNADRMNWEHCGQRPHDGLGRAHQVSTQRSNDCQKRQGKKGRLISDTVVPMPFIGSPHIRTKDLTSLSEENHV